MGCRVGALSLKLRLAPPSTREKDVQHHPVLLLLLLLPGAPLVNRAMLRAFTVWQAKEIKEVCELSTL